MEPNTERDLVERLREGDAAAFDAIHAEFNGRLFTFLLRLSRRQDVAEDLLEETWLRLVRHVRRLRPDTRLGPWLFTVARHLHVSHVRARLVEESAAAALMALWPAGAHRPSPFEEAAAGELQRHIEKALARIPAPSREVLLLVTVAGLNHAEAAAVCQTTPEAFRQRLSRARALLARALDEDGPQAARVILGATS